MTKNEIIGKVKELPGYVKDHWNTPNEGEYVSLKEFCAYTATQAGSYIFLTASGMLSFSASYFCGSIMGLSNMQFQLVNVISTIIGYLFMFMNPISVLIYENHGELSPKMRRFAHVCYSGEMVIGLLLYFVPMDALDFMLGTPQIVANILFISGITNYTTWAIRKKFCAKYGRLKPFILLCGIPSAIIMSIIPFLPIQGLPSVYKLIILHGAFTFMNFFYNAYVGVNGLVTFMTPNSQERQKLHSIVPIITGLFPSIISLFFPMLIQSTGGYLNINTYKIFVPIFGFIGVFVSFAAIHCKERVIEASGDKRKKVTFFNGAKNVLKNKYLWITNISTILGQWSALVGGLLQFWFIYSLRMEALYGVAANVVVVGMTFGNILCPILTKKFQKRNILIAFRGISLLTIVLMLFAVRIENVYVFIGAMFLRNTFQPVVDGINIGLGADIQDYHQWKYGERADSMAGVFSWFLNPVNAVLGFIIPGLLAKVGFTSDWDVLFDQAILNSVFNIYTWATIISTILMVIPFFFYDLTREKHDMCVAELQARLREIEEQDTVESEVV
ncbi:MAG: MFS transporter [Clostridia bacterium]|nr:MFS transporter [Clostridia bacterium]